MGIKTYSVEFLSKAESDIDSILEYYNGISELLANKFYIKFLETIDALVIFPKFQIKYNSIRCIMIDKFPYMIHYQIDDNIKNILVLAIVHAYKNPKTAWIR